VEAWKHPSSSPQGRVSVMADIESSLKATQLVSWPAHDDGWEDVATVNYSARANQDLFAAAAC